MFDAKTRTAIKINTNNFGDGLAGRGLGLNKTISELRPVVNNAIPVLANLASPETDFRGFFKGLPRASEEAAPVAEQQASAVDLDTFFTAWAGVARQLEEATAEGPTSLEQAIHSLPNQASLINNATEFMRLLRPSAADLVTVAPHLANAFAGRHDVNLAAATQLNSALAESSEALAKFGNNPVVTLAFEDFTQTVEVGNPVLAGVAPEQAKCNYWTLAFRNVASVESQRHRRRDCRARRLRARSERPQQRGLPLLGARERWLDRTRRWSGRQDHRQQPPAREPVPEREPPRASARSAKPARRTSSRARP